MRQMWDPSFRHTDEDAEIRMIMVCRLFAVMRYNIAVRWQYFRLRYVFSFDATQLRDRCEGMEDFFFILYVST